jgi:hypothetical protein
MEEPQPERQDSGLEIEAITSRLMELEMLVVQERSARIRCESILRQIEEGQNA